MDASSADTQAFWRLHALDFHRSEAVLHRIGDPAVLRAAPFWDHRVAPLAIETRHEPLQLALTRYRVGAHSHPAGLILHNALCGSTLMAKALSHPGKRLVAREPKAMTDLADFRRHGHALWQDRSARQRLMDFTLTQTGASPVNGETAILKLTNSDTPLAADILDAFPDMKVIFLYSGLEDFLLSVMARGLQGAVFIRQLLDVLAFENEPVAKVSQKAAMKMTDLEAATLVWRSQMERTFALAERFGPRLRTLNARDFLKDPARGAEAARCHLDPDGPPCPGAADAVYRRHSKDGQRDYSAQRRSAERSALRDRHAGDLFRISGWAETLKLDRRLPAHDPAPLLDAG
ncbi:hypothetical protein [Hyphobacterium marinum]|uniref:Sulfotransferase family protein n=1 Tax=Hyphobacterium marinum TaxID=3116574 RepID=A0ABU7LZS7_9PROT|nr:hypothetical protein [Hyphobacterium sp. Y6023]MEE2566792.1 hypothetical protein [Hyphobacterium sp. Y6023]